MTDSNTTPVEPTVGESFQNWLDASDALVDSIGHSISKALSHNDEIVMRRYSTRLLMHVNKVDYDTALKQYEEYLVYLKTKDPNALVTKDLTNQ
jgi:hypothetical protein